MLRKKGSIVSSLLTLKCGEKQVVVDAQQGLNANAASSVRIRKAVSFPAGGDAIWRQLVGYIKLS
jgi:hypothetical protein